MLHAGGVCSGAVGGPRACDQVVGQVSLRAPACPVARTSRCPSEAIFTCCAAGVRVRVTAGRMGLCLSLGGLNRPLLEGRGGVPEWAADSHGRVAEPGHVAWTQNVAGGHQASLSWLCSLSEVTVLRSPRSPRRRSPPGCVSRAI